ncbi:MAG: M3 family metallopeptidase, partial [Planctomycetota bacterium]|nr:M3 family metallopeptidase [Planctomycetota bacterium]
MHAKTTLALLAVLALGQGCARNSETTSMSGSATETQSASTRSAPAGGSIKTIADYQDAANQNRAILQLPNWEKTPAEIEKSVTDALAKADRRFDEIAKQSHDRVTFESTFAAMDDVLWQVGNVANRMSVIKYSSTDPRLRDTATEQINVLNDWFVALQYRKDLYEAAKAFQTVYEDGRRPRLHGEDLRLMEETMRDYRRAGMHLDPDTRAKVEDLQKQVARLSTEFDTNIANASVPVTYSRDELDGVPQTMLDAARQPNGEYQFMATVTPNFLAIMENASSEATRRKMKEARYSVVMEENSPLLDELVRLRDEIAGLLGYDSWADYRTEIRMAKSGENARNFVVQMAEGLEPKFAAEVAQMRKMKQADTGDQSAEIQVWDWRYYANQIKKTGFNV